MTFAVLLASTLISWRKELGDGKKAIEYAEASLKIREQIEDANAAVVRKQLQGWRNA